MQQKDGAPAAGQDEIAEVLGALRALLARAGNPIVRSCLEDAHDDIAHLTGKEDGLDYLDAEAA
jgi:hypothetical protein